MCLVCFYTKSVYLLVYLAAIQILSKMNLRGLPALPRESKAFVAVGASQQKIAKLHIKYCRLVEELDPHGAGWLAFLVFFVVRICSMY